MTNAIVAPAFSSPAINDMPDVAALSSEMSDEAWWESAFFCNAGQTLFVDDEMGEAPSDRFNYTEKHLETPRINEEDFLEGAEREAFIRVRKGIRLACNVNSHAKDREAAVNWVFVPSQEDEDGLTFGVCCRALGIRDYLLQVRLQYQFFHSCIMLPNPLPFLSVTIPPGICSEIMYHLGGGVLPIAKDIWDWPGFRADLLKRRHQDTPALDAKLRDLEARGYIAMSHGFWFFTGRNPDLLTPGQRRSFRWSQEFIS